ncbi:MAG: branched-chain amino acid ABC transporter permease [Actinomycetota bacterium]
MVPTPRLLRTGAVAGLATVYLALVGLVERFAELDLVGGSVTLGRLLVVAGALAAGYLVARPRVEAGELIRPAGWSAVASGAIAGVAAGAVFSAAIAAIAAFGVERFREFFIASTSGLVDVATFGLGVGVGSLATVALSGLAGGFGAFTKASDPERRAPYVLGASVVFLFGMLQRIIPIAMAELGLATGWLYLPSDGLTWVGGAVVFLATVGGNLAWRRRGAAIRERFAARADRSRDPVRIGMFAGLLVLALVAPLVLGSVISETLGQVMIFVLLGLGLNIVVGFAGLLDLGYVAFFAFGAYLTAILTGALLNTTTGASPPPAISFDLNFWLAAVIVAVCAAGLGLLIGAPVLRLRGDYLAIVTLGLGEIVSILATSKWAQPLVGGPQGMHDVTKAGFLGLNPQDVPQHFYYLALIFVLFAWFVSRRLASSRIGRAWNAMREDEQVADAMGISTTRFKLLAFATGGAIGSLGGALFAVNLGSLTPASFGVLVSITALAVVILGGLGSLPGVVVGALVLIGLPGLLREFEEYRLLIYGGSLIAITILRPQGLVPNVRRTRELREEERSQDAWARGLAQRAADRAGENLDEIVAGGSLGGEREDLA